MALLGLFMVGDSPRQELMRDCSGEFEPCVDSNSCAKETLFPLASSTKADTAWAASSPES